MPEQTFDPNQPFTTEEAPAAPAQPQEGTPVGSEFRLGSNPFRDEDFPEYTRLVMNRRTTPAQLTQWMEERGYGRSTNAAEVLTFHRRNPRIRPTNSFSLTPADPPAPDGMPQPGTATDWIPDFLQGDVEHLGLSLGIIDPSTYYGLGNYGPNARRPNRPTTISNPPLPSWGERFRRSVSEAFSKEGGGINAYILRANDDIRAEEAIRRYGSDHNWTGEQIDAAIRREREDRGRAIEEVRTQRRIRDNDEVRREEGLGVDPQTGEARSSWGGWAWRGSADLSGALVGDVNPTYFVAPAVRGVAPVVERAAPALGRLAERVLPAGAARVAVPVVERGIEAAAPTVARAVGQGAVQAGVNTGIQADEVERGMRDNIDPVEVGVHGLLGFTLQGGVEGLWKLAPRVARWITGRRGQVEGTVPEPAQLSQLDQDLALLAERGLTESHFSSVDEITSAAARLRAANPEAPATPTGEARGVVTLYRGEPTSVTSRQISNDEIKGTGTWFTPDKGEAQKYAGEDGTVFRLDVSEPDLLRLSNTYRADKQYFQLEPSLARSATIDAGEPAHSFTSLRDDIGEIFDLDRGAGLVGRIHTTSDGTQYRVYEDLTSGERMLDPEDAVSLGKEKAEQVVRELQARLPNNATADIAETPRFEGDVVQRLTAAINDAGKLSREQAALLSQSRSDKLKGVLEARATSSGEAGLSSELAQLRGETPRVDYEGVRGQFTQDEIDGLFNSVRDNPNLSLFDSINARTGLAKLLDGTVPTRSEINLLSQVFPADFIKAAMRHRSTSSKIADFAGNALNLPRSMMSTLDLSAPLRQGVFLAGRREFYSAFASMFKQFGSERAFRGVMDAIRARETYPLMEESGLSLTTLGHDLSQREEIFMSQWAERIPGVGRVVRASERGFSGFLNKLRADTFDDLVRRSTAAGVDFQANPKALSDIASFVNAATGRGNLGALNSSAPLLNGLLFSPRLIASRVTLLNPAYYAQLSPVVRQEAIKSLLTFGTLATSVLTMFKMGGADVETDPRSSDFGKIKIDNTRYDILGGFGQYITLGARLATNETVTLKGEEQTLGEQYGSRTRLDVAANFLANKASPVAGYVRDYLRGTDPVGTPFDARRDAMELFIPLFLQDAAKVYEDGGVEALPRIAPGFFGVGVGTYDDKPKFDPNQEFTQEVAAEPAPVPEPEEVPTFDPKQPFDTTTSGNLQAVDILANMGFHITDEGVRSEEEQANYYNNTQGAAAPGTSPHEDGNAVDIRVPQGVRPSDIVAELTARGFRGVTIITRRHGTGPHWHIQWESVGE